MCVPTKLHESAECGECVFFITAGSVRIYRVSPEGRNLTLSVRRAGEECSFTTAETTSKSSNLIEVLEDNTILHWLPLAQLLHVLAANPTSAQAALEQLTRELAAALDRFEDAALRPIEVQLAHLLMRLAPTEPPPVVSITHDELAGLLGASRERVTKALHRLRDEGLIAYERHGRSIRLLQPLRLHSR